MKLGVFSVLLGGKPLEEVLQYFEQIGVEMIEIGTGGYPGTAHADPDVLLNDANKLAEFKGLFEKYNIEISALSCHGNPVHPDAAVAAEFHAAFEKTVLLAEQLGIKHINTFSGCPGDPEGAKSPNWVT